MTSPSTITAKRGAKPNVRVIVGAGLALALIIAAALSTKVVRLNSASNSALGGFAAPTYGAAQFPKVQALVERRAIRATILAAAIAKDPAAAAKLYGVTTEAGPEFTVKFSGVVGKADSGNYAVDVSGVPKSIKIRVQTGPAIIGTDLRDATGAITFGQFTNQIDYQNAGTALNTQMKQQVLAKVDTVHLTGKKIAVVGAFAFNDPTLWLVAPVTLEVK